MIYVFETKKLFNLVKPAACNLTKDTSLRSFSRISTKGLDHLFWRIVFDGCHYTFILIPRILYYNFRFTTVVCLKNTRRKKRKYKGKIHDVALKQICDLVNCTESTLEIKVRCVLQQLNSFDCGVFSFAFLVDALDGSNDIGRNDNAEKMRFNFRTCLKNEVFSPLPRSTKRSKVCASTILFANVYYICRWPFFEHEVEEDPNIFMFTCSKYNEWYHRKCVTIPENIFENSRRD